MANDKKEVREEVNIEALRAELEAEIRAETEAKVKAEYEAKIKEAEEKAAKEEARMEKELEKQEQSLKEKLAKEKKVKIFIPENPLNPNEVVPVGLNGVVYAIPVGQEFEVPESIYKVWKYSFDKTREAKKKMNDILTKEIRIMD